MLQQPVMPHEAPIHGGQNLPVQPPDRLFGRSADLNTIHLALKAATAVLVHGPAGIGKTALVAALAVSYAELPGGILWLDLDDDSLLSLLNRVARAYSAEVLIDSSHPEQQIARVRQLLQDHHPLLVLDGRVRIDAAREFTRECASGVSLLLTHDKMIAGPWMPHSLDALEAEDAAGMLTYLTGVEVQHDAESLNNALAGHPLSIVLAGRQLKAGNLKPDDFLAQLPDLPPGPANRAMAAITAAYRLLPPDLQGMIMLLGTAFQGSASEELLSDVSGAPGNVLRARMRQLETRGFVTERDLYDQPGYAVHELVQRFAQSFLRSKQRYDTMLARHVGALPVYIRRHTAETSPDHYRRLAAEMPTILAAGQVAAQQQKVSFLNELIQLLEPVSPESFVAACAFQPELDRLKALLAPPAPEPEQYKELGQAVQEQDTVAAQPLLPQEEGTEPAPDLIPAALPPTEIPPAAPAEAGPAETTGFQADGSIEDELAAIEALAAMSLENANYAEVLGHVERGMTLAQTADNPRREAELLVVLGDLQGTLGKFEGAERAYQEAVAAFRPTEAWLDIGLVLDKLGLIYWDQGRVKDALDMWNQTLPIFQRVGRSDLRLTALDRVGDAEVELGMWESAQVVYEQALALAEAAQEQWAVYELLSKLAWVLESRGQREAALLHYRRALNLVFGLDDAQELGETLLALARLLIDDTMQLGRTLQLLEAANQNLPADTEVQRLLNRAKTRQDRLLKAGVTLPFINDSLQDYAQAAQEKS